MFTKLKTLSDLVVLPHSVFALPFALVSLLAATGGRPPLRTVVWVVICMVLARTAAMAYNRLVDAPLDALNPRTQNRPLPAGKMTLTQVRVLVWVSGFLFVLAAGQLNRLCLILSPWALAVVFFYSHTKHFTWASHFFLGLALGVAPPAAWFAATGAFSIEPLWLTSAVICFVAGFDILYATQDVSFDKAHHLNSWVVRWGVLNSLWASRILHILMLGFLSCFGRQLNFSLPYFAGLILLGLVLAFLHLSLAGLDGNGFRYKPFVMALNGWVAVLYLVIVGAVLWLF